METAATTAHASPPAGEIAASRPARRDPGFVALMVMWALVPLITSNFTATGLVRLPWTYDQTELPKAIVVLLLTWFGLLVWAISLSGRREWRLPLGSAALAAFLVVLGVSTVVSVSPLHSVFGWYTRYDGLLTYLTYAGLYFLSVQVLSPARWVILARVGLAVGALASLYGVLQALGHDPTDWLTTSFETVRSFSTYGNPDFFADYLIIPIAFGLVLLVVDQSRFMKVATVIGVALCVVGEITTLARGGWIGTVVAGAVVFAALARAGVRPWKALGVLLLLAVIVTAFVQTGSLNPVSRLKTLVSGSDAGVFGRTAIWRAGTRAFADRPILGSGPDTFVYAAQRYMPVGTAERADNAHSLPLQLAVTTGILGLLCFAAFVMRVFSASARKALTPDKDDERSLCYLGAWAAGVGYIVSLSVGLSLPGTTSLLFIVLALIARPLSPPRAMPVVARLVVVAVMVVLAVLASFVSYRALRADWVFIRARTEARAGRSDLELMRKAVLLNPVPERYQIELRAAEARE